MRRFIQKYQKWAVDERCQCSHARGQHGGLEVRVRGRAVHEQGLGRCDAAGCDCAKFRRSGWVFEGEQPAG
jgi:hypothetical protein